MMSNSFLTKYITIHYMPIYDAFGLYCNIFIKSHIKYLSLLVSYLMAYANILSVIKTQKKILCLQNKLH